MGEEFEEGDIYVGSDVKAAKFCSVCDSRINILRVEVNTFEENHRFHLCNNCAKELSAQLDSMTY